MKPALGWHGLRGLLETSASQSPACRWQSGTPPVTGSRKPKWLTATISTWETYTSEGSTWTVHAREDNPSIQLICSRQGQLEKILKSLWKCVPHVWASAGKDCNHAMHLRALSLRGKKQALLRIITSGTYSDILSNMVCVLRKRLAGEFCSEGIWRLFSSANHELLSVSYSKLR